MKTHPLPHSLVAVSVFAGAWLLLAAGLRYDALAQDASWAATSSLFPLLTQYK